MIDVRRLRLLSELSHRGTITAVADALAYTPSAVSQQLAALEREAGVPLLERSGRRVALTPAGVVLARYAESVLAVLEEAAAALAATRVGLTGRLRIGAFPSAAHTILPPALVTLGREHPGLELMVTELDPVAVPGALRAGTIDVALTLVGLTLVAARRRTSIAYRKGTSRHPAVSAFAAAVREQSQLLTTAGAQPAG
jgi:DNA-binding transcriptional LysR family regulator